MAAWARKVARNPNATTPADIQALRDAGLDDGQIFAITTFVALRLAFSTIDDALGTAPNAQLAESLPAEVREAVTFGCPVATSPLDPQAGRVIVSRATGLHHNGPLPPGLSSAPTSR